MEAVDVVSFVDGTDTIRQLEPWRSGGNDPSVAEADGCASEADGSSGKADRGTGERTEGVAEEKSDAAIG